MKHPRKKTAVQAQNITKRIRKIKQATMLVLHTKKQEWIKKEQK